MAETGIRTGRVSVINYATGMVQVVYVDKGKSVTAEIPCLNFNDEYKMPAVGSLVAVAHLENGSSRGIVLGNVWNRKSVPPEQGKTLYRKDLSRTAGAAYVRYSDDSGEYMVHAPAVILNGITKAHITGAVVEIEANSSAAIVTPVFSLEAPEIAISGGEGGAVEIKNEADLTFSSAEKKVEAEIKEVLIKALESYSLEAAEEISLKTESNIELEDATYKTTLSSILSRLEALDGNSSARK